MAQNLVRQKIPPTDDVAQLNTKSEIEPAAEKSVPSEQEIGPQEEQKPATEADLAQSPSPREKSETVIPAVEKAIPPQENVALPEERELQTAEFSAPSKPKTEIETPLPVEEKAISSHPGDAPSEKAELTEETELEEPMERSRGIEISPPEEKEAVSSQPGPELAEQKELVEESKLNEEEMQPPPSEMDAQTGKTEERSIRREKWLLIQEASYYTIQLMGVHNKALLFDFVKQNHLLEQNEIAFCQTTFQEEPWFQLLYGVYKTKMDALSAAENLPAKIRKSSPWVRRLSGVQKAIRRRAGQ